MEDAPALEHVNQNPMIMMKDHGVLNGFST